MSFKKNQNESDEDNMAHTDSLTISADELLARFGVVSSSSENNNKEEQQEEDNKTKQEREQAQKLSNAPARPQDDEETSSSYRTFEVECWENMRWYPVIGWSTKLLPTDRYQWSSKDGKQNLTKENFDKNQKYDWVGGWERYVMPKETDMEGWQYAIDFPATYKPEWFVGVCVKRRMWTRKFRVKS